MKVFKQIVFTALLLFFTSSAILACTCIRESLSDRIKKAEAVFVGQIAKNKLDDEVLVQDNGKGGQTLEVVKAWKGVNKRFISVGFNFPEKPAGMCLTLAQFYEDRRYLVFAYGKDLEVETVCSDTYEISDNPNALGYHLVKNDLRRLDNFWFRFRNKLKLF